jgi:hypothetical protein
MRRTCRGVGAYKAAAFARAPTVSDSADEAACPAYMIASHVCKQDNKSATVTFF